LESDRFKDLIEDVSHRRLTRRLALARAAAGGAALATMSAAGLGLKTAGAQDATPSMAAPAFVEGADLTEPEVRSSVNGVLETTMTAKLGPTTVAGQPVTA